MGQSSLRRIKLSYSATLAHLPTYLVTAHLMSGSANRSQTVSVYKSSLGSVSQA